LAEDYCSALSVS